MSLSNVFTDVLPKGGKIAILAGAGISLDSPSNLLDGWSFMFEALRRVCPPGIDDVCGLPTSELLKDNKWRESWLLSILEPPRATYWRPGEQLRFEVLMGELAQSGFDPNLTVLNCLDECNHPNVNHYILAEMIRHGHTVITTNFDRLIEVAYARLPGASDIPLKVVCMDEDFPDKGLPQDGKPTLWKIHGSMTVDGKDTMASVQATMTSMLASSLIGRKKAFLSNVLRDYDLFVTGYSGWDDLDIVPVLANTHSNKRLVWIEHKNIPLPIVKSWEDLDRERTAQFETDCIGRERILFYIDERNEEIRPKDMILSISTQTSQFMDALNKVYLATKSFDIADDKFEFGRNYPNRVKEYFDLWIQNLSFDRSTPFAFIADVFSNRAEARADCRQSIQNVCNRRDELWAAPDASPREQLYNLMETHDTCNDQKSILQSIKKSVLKLLPSLDATLKGTATRLLACVTWKLDGPKGGIKKFMEAVLIDRKAGRMKEEFSTLTSWRSFTDYPQSRDILADYDTLEIAGNADATYLQQLMEEDEEIIRMSKGILFPIEQTYRIYELAGKIGHFPVLWIDAIRNLTYGIDEDPIVLRITHRKVHKIHRFSVDVGDVSGEATSTLILARMYMIYKKYGLALEELLRVKELNRIINDTRLADEFNEYFEHCLMMKGAEDYVVRMTPLITKSFWRA